MKIEDIILTCIKEHPGISAKRIVSCLDSKTNNLLVTEETNSQASIFKQLRNLKKKGNLHNRGDRWYFINGNIG
ncbi:hypothetical protein ABLO26_08575 [Neobacillus sp. 179-J 1A1 HS]|uniref:hypothetical protein n=1 Tax=Neobacillus driksii TaxID=3035913 RepID=UPI0035BC7FE5